jgi:hypothetical protein
MCLSALLKSPFRSSAQRSRLDSILKGVAGQVGGLLWENPESGPATVDAGDEGPP